ncbi:hypothetical protein B0H17DRAFT_1194234 [Mycena rosella]|uniref:Uncharacterized protein n=1 Tax=Mycena rosella TaxID=1033263 RepID=A0AAD7DYW5_MYCRO|nr:hypothetical protein B0H17DRAFT_1194234 [Mycena rosella]
MSAPVNWKAETEKSRPRRPDALVHLENPLHPGVEGMPLFVGIFKNGERRLLFSSAQVDYVRYWLHAMDLTNEIISLPRSEYLITESDLSAVECYMHRDGKLSNAAKRIKNGSKERASLNFRRAMLERVRKFWETKTGGVRWTLKPGSTSRAP